MEGHNVAVFDNQTLLATRLAPRSLPDGPKTSPVTILVALLHHISLCSQQRYTKSKSGRSGGEAEGNWVIEYLDTNR